MAGPEELFFFVHEYHDFLICFDASQCCRNCRIRDSVSAPIKRRWKIIRRIYKHILASKKFSQSILFVEEEGFQDQTALSLFTVPKQKKRWLICWLIWLVHRIFIERERTRKQQALQDFWIKIFKVFRYSVSETIPMFFNRLKGDFVPVRSLRNFVSSLFTDPPPLRTHRLVFSK